MVLPSGTMNSCSWSLAWQVLHLKTEKHAVKKQEEERGSEFCNYFPQDHVFVREHHYRTRVLNYLPKNCLDRCCRSALVSMRIRIQRSKPMRIHADPDPGQTFKQCCDFLRFRFRLFCLFCQYGSGSTTLQDSNFFHSNRKMFRIREVLVGIRISVHWITDPDPAYLFSGFQEDDKIIIFFFSTFFFW
jgi:hypothetical protein